MNPGLAMNWSAAATWSGGVAPIDDDDVITPEGTFQITDGLDQSAINLKSWRISNKAHIEIGSPASPLLINVDGTANTGLVNRAASGNLYISGTVPKSIHESQVARTWHVGGAVALIIAAAPAGLVIVGAAATLGDLYAPRGHIDVAAHASDRIANAWIGDGKIITRRSIEQGYGAGRGMLELQKAATIADGASTAKMRLLNPAFVMHVLCNAAITIDAIDGFAGTFTPESSEGIITVSALVETAALKFIENYDAGKVVVTARTTYGTPGSQALAGLGLTAEPV